MICTRPKVNIINSIIMTVSSLVVSMTQLSILSVSPREQLPVSGDGHGVSPSSIHSHLSHHVHAEVTEDPRRGDATQPPHSKTTAGTFPTGIDLPVLGDDEESLGSTH